MDTFVTSSEHLEHHSHHQSRSGRKPDCLAADNEILLPLKTSALMLDKVKEVHEPFQDTIVNENQSPELGYMTHIQRLNSDI